MDDGTLSKLSPEQQRALLAELLRKRASATAATQSSPMSAGQQGLWFAYCRDPHATPFNVFLPARIRSNLDLGALQKTIEYLADRHACLRTTFTDSGGEQKQIVHAKLAPEFKVIDATHLLGNEAELQTLVSAESQRPFNLQQGPLLRLAVFQLAADDYVVLASTHHIVVDFWSLILMLAELRQVYPSFVVGRQPALPPAANNYAEFVTDQQLMLESSASESLRSYWLEQLGDAPTTLDLVTDYERPPSVHWPRGDSVAGLVSRCERSHFSVGSDRTYNRFHDHSCSFASRAMSVHRPTRIFDRQSVFRSQSSQV